MSPAFLDILFFGAVRVLMKLAICHPVVEPARGGCETYIAMLLHRLCKDGHQVHLLASRWDAAALPERLVLHHLPDFSHPRVLRPWRFSAAVARELARESFDLSLGFDKVIGVDVQFPQGGVYVAAVEHGRQRFPTAWQRTMAHILRMLTPAHWSMKWLEERQYTSEPMPFVIAISDFTRKHLMRYLGVPASHIQVLRPAIDPSRLFATDRPARRAVARQQWGIEPDEVFAIFLGVNPRLKGIEPLLNAVAHMGDRRRFRLGVFGAGKAHDYESLARRLGISENVRFLGYHPDIRDIYFAGDMLVHPTFYDPCSLVVLEATAVGLPVITTRSNGAAELLDPPADSRIITNPHDPVPLAVAMQAFLDNDTRRAASKAALRSASLWTFEDHYREFMHLLDLAWRRKRAA
jgi:UDP-glucose:(heptosyl)LPS alpha-1,3-glucosyltransferase